MGSTTPLKGWQLIDYISITKCLKNNKVLILSISNIELEIL